MIRAIFFDFDGTIVDSRKVESESTNELLDQFKIKLSHKKALELMGVREEIYFREVGIPKSKRELASKIFWKIYNKKSLEKNSTNLCVSVKPLEKLSKDYPLFIVSNSRSHYLNNVLKKLEIKKLFKGVYGCDQFSTKSAMLKELFKKMKIKPLEAIYIGDRFSDIIFARKAGCISVAIQNKSSWSTLNKVVKENPDFLIKDFYGLKKIVETLNKN